MNRRAGGPTNDRWQVSPRNPDGSRREVRVGPHLGPIRLTPTRVTLGIALFGSAGFLAYSITVRDASQIPLLSSGAAVLGIVFAALAVAGVLATVQAGRDGQSGRAFVMAILGGVAAVIAAACFSSAAILALVWKV
jgi:hypothetical protein